MLKKVILLTVAVMLLTAAGIFFYKNSTYSQKDITGWQKLAWGMTHDQVSKLYKLDPWQSTGGIASCALTDEIELVGLQFKGYLYFSEKTDNGKLTEVLLMGDGLSSKLMGLPELYANQYGPPTKTDPATPMKNWSWDRKSARLMLMIVQDSGEDSDMMDISEEKQTPDDKANCSIRYISAITTK